MSFRALVLLAAVAGGVVLAGLGVAALRSGQPDLSADAYRGSEPPAVFRLVDFALRDETGRLFRAGDLRGKVVVLTFLDSQCEETCPLVAGLVAEGLARMPARLRRSVVAVAISTDPGEDTQASRRAFLDRHGADGAIHYLAGTPRELVPVWKGFQILSSQESGNDQVHSAPVRVYDPSGVWVSTLHAGADLTPANLAHDVRQALGREGASR